MSDYITNNAVLTNTHTHTHTQSVTFEIKSAFYLRNQDDARFISRTQQLQSPCKSGYMGLTGETLGVQKPS